MDHFADIFVAFQKLGKTDKQDERDAYRKKLDPWTSPNARGKERVASRAYAVKCVGYELVCQAGALTERRHKACSTLSGRFTPKRRWLSPAFSHGCPRSLGLPQELHNSKTMRTVFGFKWDARIQYQFVTERFYFPAGTPSAIGLNERYVL
jgi:hypothetical protein